MTSQPYLTDGKTETSRAAGEKIAPHAESLEAQVYEQIVLAGVRGLCSFEVGEILGLKHQTVSARCTGLKHKGLIRANGWTRLTEGKCKADVLIATALANHCRTCGARIPWPEPAGVIYADGSAECISCLDREM